jgi:hypothetical protein
MIDHFVQDSRVMGMFESVPKSSIVIPYKAGKVPFAVTENAGPGRI